MNNNVMYFPQVERTQKTLAGSVARQNENNIIIVNFVLEAKLKCEKNELERLRNAFDNVRGEWVLEPAELSEMNKRHFK